MADTALPRIIRWRSSGAIRRLARFTRAHPTCSWRLSPSWRWAESSSREQPRAARHGHPAAATPTLAVVPAPATVSQRLELPHPLRDVPAHDEPPPLLLFKRPGPADSG